MSRRAATQASASRTLRGPFAIRLALDAADGQAGLEEALQVQEQEHERRTHQHSGRREVAPRLLDDVLKVAEPVVMVCTAYVVEGVFIRNREVEGIENRIEIDEQDDNEGWQHVSRDGHFPDFYHRCACLSHGYWPVCAVGYMDTEVLSLAALRLFDLLHVLIDGRLRLIERR